MLGKASLGKGYIKKRKLWLPCAKLCRLHSCRCCFWFVWISQDFRSSIRDQNIIFETHLRFRPREHIGPMRARGFRQPSNRKCRKVNREPEKGTNKCLKLKALLLSFILSFVIFRNSEINCKCLKLKALLLSFILSFVVFRNSEINYKCLGCYLCSSC
jgi:hypothetical protein